MTLGVTIAVLVLLAALIGAGVLIALETNLRAL